MLEWLILAAPFLGIFAVLLKKYKIVPLFTLLSLIIVLLNLNNSALITFKWLPFASFGLWLNKISIFLAAIISFCSTIVLWYSLAYMKQGLQRFYLLMLLFSGLMLGVVLAPNLLELFIFWEGLSICSYFLIQHKREAKARRAAITSFLTIEIGDICLLLALLISYTQLGTFSIPIILSSELCLLAPLLAIAAFAKCAQFPFHYWLPLAMEAPTPVSALLHSATLVQAGVYLLARFFPLLKNFSFIAYLAAFSAILTAIFALSSKDLKRILAYSTCSQIGYMLVGSLTSLAGVFASLLFLASHAIYKPLLFLCAGNIERKLGTRNIAKMRKVSKLMPLTFLFFVLGALSLAGVPPLSGFWAKGFVSSAVAAPGLTIMLHLGFIVTLAYSFRMLIKMRGASATREEVGGNFLLPIFVIALGIPATVLLIPSYSSWIGITFQLELSALFILPISFGFFYGWLKVPSLIKESIFNVAFRHPLKIRSAFCGFVVQISRLRRTKKLLAKASILNPTEPRQATLLTIGGLLALLLLILL